MIPRIKNPARRELGKLGNIRIGEKRIGQSGSEYPASTDYFIATSENNLYVDEFHKLYGDKPTSLTIRFYNDDGLQHHYELRDSSGKLLMVSNGAVFKFSNSAGGFDEINDVETGKAMTHAAIKANTTAKYKPVVKETLRIRFVIEGLPLLGYWEFKTYGKDTTIPKILGPYDMIADNRGTVVGMPFRLVVEKHTSNVSGQAKSYPIVSLFAENIGHDPNTKAVGGGPAVVEAASDVASLGAGEAHYYEEE